MYMYMYMLLQGFAKYRWGLNSCICMVIPYQTAKFKSVNIFSVTILGPIAKFYICGYTVVFMFGTIVEGMNL